MCIQGAGERKKTQSYDKFFVTKQTNKTSRMEMNVFLRLDVERETEASFTWLNSIPLVKCSILFVVSLTNENTIERKRTFSNHLFTRKGSEQFVSIGKQDFQNMQVYVVAFLL